MYEIYEKKIMLGDKEATIRLGEYAHQANGNVILQCGETVVHAVATMGDVNPDLDFFPLTVEYSEALYAGGIIKSSRFIKREGKPSDEAILKARLIDRSIRPMFPKEFKREVQVVVNILASDKENPHDMLGLNAVIAALAVSDIPFNHHLGGIRLSSVKDELVINPTYEQCQEQDYELILTGNENRIVMIECAANCVNDDLIQKGFEESYSYLGKIADQMDELQKEYGKEKEDFLIKDFPESLVETVKEYVISRIDEYSNGLESKKYYKQDYKKVVVLPVIEHFKDLVNEEISESMIKEALDKIYKKKVREDILTNKMRVDKRAFNEIRDIEIRIDPLPQVHGSSMFRRGETQVLNIMTLAAPGNEQLMESIEGEVKKSYIHHYNAPPYSVGECGRFGFPGRREIGHGALAEKALKPVLPEQEKFPYVIRLVSEIMGQNGSSSMASTCASTVTLMAGGVPIKAPVAGISIGLMTGEDGQFETLTDIRGIEDFAGDMDFKVAGTRDGITAIQMDTKIKGLTIEIVRQALKQAKEARNMILDKISDIIPSSRNELSVNAPKIETVQINPEDIGKVVGSNGKVIKQLVADYEVEIFIEDDGVVTISGVKQEKIDEVKTIINGIVTPPTVGGLFKGKVTRILDFGAFVELFPGKEGLVHISKLSKERVNNVTDVLSVGQEVTVKLLNIDSQHRLNLTLLLDEEYNPSTDNRDRDRGDRDRRHNNRSDKKFIRSQSTQKKNN